VVLERAQDGGRIDTVVRVKLAILHRAECLRQQTWHLLRRHHDAILTVNNRGAPIPAAFLAVIFEPFRREVRDRDRSPHGLGLGLYIVQQIVLAHRGDIQVESNAEDGTTFTMRLPRA